MKIDWRRVFLVGTALTLTLGCGTCQIAGCVLGDVSQSISYTDSGEGALWALAVVLVVFTAMLAMLGNILGGGGRYE